MNASRPILPSDATAEERMAKLRHYGLLELADTKVYQDLTRLASTICQAPVCFITLLTKDSQHFKAMSGIRVNSMPIEDSFCTHAVDTPQQQLVVNDARLDARFAKLPVVTQDPHLISYLGSPLVTDDGVALGTICVLDHEAREFTQEQREALEILARQVMDQVVLKQRVHELERSQYQLESLNRQLDQFAYIISHDLKAPIRHQSSFAQMIVEDFGGDLSPDVHEYLKMIQQSGGKAQGIITDLSDYLHTIQTAFGERHPVSLRTAFDEVVRLSGPPPQIKVTTKVHGEDVISVNPTALRHILLNLVANAIKFNDQVEGHIELTARYNGDDIIVSVADNGPGLSGNDKEHIFQLFSQGSQGARHGGKGLGLAIATKLAQNMGGDITVTSAEGEGATFHVVLPLR